MFNQHGVFHRMLLWRTILLLGGDLAPRPRGALWCHALCPVPLRTGKSCWTLIPLFIIADCALFNEKDIQPTGVSACLQQKSRRKVSGKVNCRNIKQDCPTLDCDDSVLLPGHCCRTCQKGTHALPQTQFRLF